MLKIANFRCRGNKDLSESNVTGIVELAGPENHTIIITITTHTEQHGSDLGTSRIDRKSFVSGPNYKMQNLIEPKITTLSYKQPKLWQIFW